MSSKEVKATEQTVIEIINGDNAVYAKESPLPSAKEINGIRAIFDEVSVVVVVAAIIHYIDNLLLK